MHSASVTVRTSGFKCLALQLEEQTGGGDFVVFDFVLLSDFGFLMFLVFFVFW